jgi:hypothetical protein
MSEDPRIAVATVTDVQEKHLTPARQFQGIPGIERTAGGRLWANWYTGGVNEGPENFVVLVTSEDDGATWTEPVAVVDPPGNVRAYDPTLWIDPLGRLWLFWAQTYSHKDGNIFDGAAGVWAVRTEDPESASPTWSEPIFLADGIMMNKPTVLSNGEWAFPCAVWNNHGGGTVPEDLLAKMTSGMVISADQGETFAYRGGADVPKRSFDEHMFVEHNDGSVRVYVRTFYGIGQSVSTDKGVTWSPGEDSGLGGPSSRFFVRRLQSGKLLLINHKTIEGEKPARNHLFAWLSEDDGASWVGGLELDERMAVSYPDGTQDVNGDIWIIYDHERYKCGDILFARFREEDVMAGECVSANASLKNLINRTGGVRS